MDTEADVTNVSELVWDIFLTGCRKTKLKQIIQLFFCCKDITQKWKSLRKYTEEAFKPLCEMFAINTYLSLSALEI